MAKGDDGVVHALVTEHVAAFNAHDRARLLAGLAPDVVWSAGEDTFRGTAALSEVFDDELWAMNSSLTVLELIVDGDRAAAQLLEVVTVEGRETRFTVGAFFEVTGGLLARVKLFRKGSAGV